MKHSAVRLAMATIYEIDIAKFRPETQPKFPDKFNSIKNKSRRPSNQQINPAKCAGKCI